MLFHTYMLCYIQVIIINNLIIADDDIYVHAGQIKLSLSISTNVERFFYQTVSFTKLSESNPPTHSLGFY